MGVKQSCPSDALDNVWIEDKDAPHCFNCGTGFTMRRRRHHCRCCGGVFCVACWGEQVTLEEAYGFPGPVPICTICADVFKYDGGMFLLRKGVTVAQTHESRSSVTVDSQVPPLANTNIRARKFKTNLLTLYHWRPFTKKTKLQYTKTKSSKEILRAARSAGLTPRGESSLSARESSVGSNPNSNSPFLNTGAGGEDAWTIGLDEIESIQLMSFDERAGGEFICITTGMEEHRIQAVKVRFEEVAAAPNPPSSQQQQQQPVPIPQLENNNNNNTLTDGGGGVSPSQQQSLSARGGSSSIPMPANVIRRRSNSANNISEYDGGASLISGGGGFSQGQSLRRRGNSMRQSGSMSARGSSFEQRQVQFDASAENNNNNQNSTQNNNTQNNNNNFLSDGTESTTQEAGGEKCSASDRRSTVSTGTRLRTVMLDKNGTRALYSALLRAHSVCQKRAQHVPAEVKCAVEVDLPEDEVQIGSNPTTPRAIGGGRSQSVGGGGTTPNTTNHPFYQDSATVASSEDSHNKAIAVEKMPRARAYSMA